MIETYDFIVIGGGSAGYAGAAAAAKLGLQTLVIEGGEEVGGLCILRGCMPSKTLLESGHRALAIREAAEFGLKAKFEGADGTAIRDRKRRLISEFAQYRQEQLSSGRFDFLRGRARFLDPHSIEVELIGGGVQRITGRTFLIATGSRISQPYIEGLEEAGFWTSDDVLDTEELPRSVCILGAGAIGLEAASYYHGLGIPTAVIQRSTQVMKELDKDVAAALTAALERRGIEIFRDTQLLKVEAQEGCRRVHFEHHGRPKIVEAERIVSALGRSPATDGLALEAAGVTQHRGRIIAAPTQECGAPHLFAAGDVCGPLEVVHTAIQQGEIAARNAARLLGRLEGAAEQMDYTLKLFVCFTHPEVAFVGLTEDEAKQQGRTVLSASYPFSDHGKSMVRGATDGFVKLIADPVTKRLLGGACIGPDAAELIHEIVVAIRFGATAQQLATTPHYHPTLSEIWTYPAEELSEL